MNSCAKSREDHGKDCCCLSCTVPYHHSSANTGTWLGIKRATTVLPVGAPSALTLEVLQKGASLLGKGTLPDSLAKSHPPHPDHSLPEGTN